VYDSRLSDVEFYEVSSTPHRMELQCDSVIRHRLLVAQGKACQLRSAIKLVTRRSNPCCRMLLSMLQKPANCVMICGSVRALEQCVSWSEVGVYVVRDLCGREVIFRNFRIFVFEHGIWYTATSFHTFDSTRSRAATFPPERYVRKYSMNSRYEHFA
jgi:hypothetical protein